jgi:hypothetical protein
MGRFAFSTILSGVKAEGHEPGVSGILFSFIAVVTSFFS